MSSLGDLEARLRGLLGLSGYEARAYLALLRLGRGRPGEIAREARVPQQRIYDVLRSLERRGLVRGSPEGYEPIPPREALAAEGERGILEARRRAEALAALAGELEGLAQGLLRRESVQLIHGLAQALAWASSIASLCPERPIFTAYKAVEKLRETWPLLRSLLDRLPRGALVVVPRGAFIPEEDLRYAVERGVEVVRGDCVFLDLMVACDRVVIGLPGPAGDVVGVIVESEEFAEAVRRQILSVLASTRR